MRRFLAIAALFAATVAPWRAVPAAEFPVAFRGLWISGNSCDDAAGFALFASDFGLTGLFLPGKDGKFTVFGFDTGVIRDATPNRLVTRFPFPDEGGGNADFMREIKDGRLYSGLSQSDKRTVGARCAAIATPNPRARILVRLLRRLDRFARGYSEIQDACGNASGDAKPCAREIVALLDLNGDGKVSPAEVTAFLRRYMPAVALLGDKDATFRGGYRIVKIEPDDLAAVEATTAVFGPFLTNIVFSNFDYDGSGFLTADEIAR